MSPLNITQPLGIWSTNVCNGYYKVMSNIPKMGHLPTPVKFISQLSHLGTSPRRMVYSLPCPILVPSGELTKSYWKLPFSSWNFPLKLVIFHCYVSSPEGKISCQFHDIFIARLSHTSYVLKFRQFKRYKHLYHIYVHIPLHIQVNVNVHFCTHVYIYIYIYK